MQALTLPSCKIEETKPLSTPKVKQGDESNLIGIIQTEISNPVATYKP